MKFDQPTTEKLWGIASRLPFESPYFIELKRQSKINPKDYFGSSLNQFVLELGSGWGEVAIELARKNPTTGFILMEKNRDRLQVTIREINKFQLKNIKLICCNFNWFLKELFLENSFDKMILNFPDPWPKKKHWHNRTLNSEFIETVNTLLKSKGIFLFATDHGGYGRVAIRTFRKTKLFKPIGSEYLFIRKEFPVSKFEREKQLENKTIYYLEREKVD
ncbi:MAG: methyltransferase domain-containing protein [Leptospiraceae bacterium]|nr:methyltransferase domain-containing protein [Leptospiraceae bacterium]